MESFRATDILFICEQDGDSEKTLKARLVPLFQSDLHVAEAYLTKVRYSESSETQIVLCLATGGSSCPEIVEAVGSEFRKMFNASVSLDILFLTPSQHSSIRLVANPFYRGE
jgi:hypothetical protein